MNKNRTYRWLGWLAAGLMAVTMAGCGGDDPTGPQGTPGGSGSQGPSGPPGPPGASGNFNVAFVTPQEWEAAQFEVRDVSITNDDKPEVEFSVFDNQGRPVQGLETLTSKSSTATVAQYPNLSFAIAKLMPRTDAKPSSWVSYIVTDPPTTTCNKTLPARPTTDNTGTLEAVEGKPGSYRYTFYRNVRNMESEVAALPERPTDPKDPCFATRSGTPQYPAPSKGDLGNLAWQPDLPHRLTIQVGGAAPGTGSNTPNGVQVTAAVNMANPVNATLDYVPASGRLLTPSELTREDVSIDNCNVCHGKLAFHGGSARVETRYCVVCHTDQRAYGQVKVTSTRDTTTNGFDSITFPKLTETARADPITGITSFSYKPDTAVADGEVAGNFTTMIHKIHQGHTLVKQNYHYAGAAFNLKGFSKLNDGQKMCTTCHGGTDATTATNYREIPSRKSCGACHDGINWDTGTGSTLGDKSKVVYATDTLPSTGHLGGSAKDDGTCKSCHTSDNIKIAHRTENITPNNPAIEAGLAVFTYEIASAAVNATTNDVTIKFRILKQIADSTGQVKDVQGEYVTFLPPAVQPNPALILDGFTGSPSFVLAWAMKQDEIGSPIDYNNQMTNADDGKQNKQAQPLTVAISALLNASTSATSANINTVGSLSARDPNDGYYTATLRGNGSAVCGDSSSRMKCVFPVGAKLRAVGLQGYFSQVSGPAAPPRAAVPREAISVVKSVNGDTARRVVVAKEKCAGCHEWLELHGGNRVLDPQICVMCHVPGLATSGRGIPDATLNVFNFNIAQTKILSDWKFDKTAVNAALKLPVTSNNFKDMIHGIHAGRDRVTPFQDARDSTSRGSIDLLDFRRMDFPGKLNNCETCHVTATGTTATYNTIPSGGLASTYESIDSLYAAAIPAKTATPADAKRSLITANATDTVTTPFTAACVSCHDGSAAKAHMAINGGQLSVPRATALPKNRPLEDVESCAVCHGPGREFDTAKVHK